MMVSINKSLVWVKSNLKITEMLVFYEKLYSKM